MQCVTATFPSWGVTFDVNFLNWLKLSFINLPFALRSFHHSRCGTVQKLSRPLFSRCQRAAASGHRPDELLPDPRQHDGQLLDHPRCRLATKPRRHIGSNYTRHVRNSRFHLPGNCSWQFQQKRVQNSAEAAVYQGLPGKQLPIICPSWDFVLLSFITTSNYPRKLASFARLC